MTTEVLYVNGGSSKEGFLTFLTDYLIEPLADLNSTDRAKSRILSTIILVLMFFAYVGLLPYWLLKPQSFFDDFTKFTLGSSIILIFPYILSRLGKITAAVWSNIVILHILLLYYAFIVSDNVLETIYLFVIPGIIAFYFLDWQNASLVIIFSSITILAFPMMFDVTLLDVLIIPYFIYLTLMGLIGTLSEYFIEVQKSEQEQIHQEDVERLHNQKFDLLSQFSRGISHDMNNVLTIIYGYLELIKDTKNNGIDNKYISEMESAIEKIHQLMENLRRFTYKTTIPSEIINITEVIEYMVPILEKMIDEKISLSYEVHIDNPRVKLQKFDLEKILLHLVKNSSEAIQGMGEIIIAVKGSNKTEINMSHKQVKHIENEKYIILEIEDNGKGMSKNEIKNIFNPYYTTKDSGHGMGLTSVNNIVDQANGFIQIMTEVDKGTKIKIYLPDNPISEVN